MAGSTLLRARRVSTQTTRIKVVDAVREMLADGTFQTATVEDVAERAGVSRAGLYQHFGSRIGLVDAVCETLGEDPDLQAIFACLELSDALEGLKGVLGHSVRFWSRHEALHRHLYALAEVDEASATMVRRQTADRRTRLEAFTRRLAAEGRLRVPQSHAAAYLMLLTSFGTYLELRRTAGRSEAATVRLLEGLANTAVIAEPAT
jgi:AcrR family transcriptional regulator